MEKKNFMVCFFFGFFLVFFWVSIIILFCSLIFFGLDQNIEVPRQGRTAHGEHPGSLAFKAVLQEVPVTP